MTEKDFIMKLSNELLKASLGLADGRSYRMLTRHHQSTLHGFYRSLNQEERRIRFGGAVSDDAIARHCDQIDWRSTLVIAFGTALSLDAVSVNVRIDTRRVENATVARADGTTALPTLLRLSAVASRDLFAAKRMLVNLEGTSWLLRHLREMSSTVLNEEFAELDVTSIAEEPALVDDDRSLRMQVDGRAARVCG